MVNQKVHENQQLKAQVENLRTENKFLKAVSEAINRCFHGNIRCRDASNAADRDQTFTWWSRGRLLLPEEDILIRLQQIYGGSSNIFA